MRTYENLSSPFKLGGMHLKNRIVMPPMGTGLSNKDGEVTPQLIRYYERRAAGGVAMIVVEIACVDSPRGRAGFTQLCIDDPKYLPGLAELADAIHAHDCRAAIQLHHAGRQTTTRVAGQSVVGPSALPCKLTRAETVALNREEIQSVIKKFVSAAFIAAQAGFDAVELHAAHGYLLSQFISPYTNRREDEYGGNTANRARLLLEIIKLIKQKMHHLTVGVRLNLDDFVPGGLQLEESIEIARLVEAAGADYISVSAGIYESGQISIEPAAFQEGWRIYLAEALRQQVNLPLLAGGVIRHPAVAEEIIASGKADLVWVGRGILADPDWPYKALFGREQEIRPCISCNTCIDCAFAGKAIKCAINPRAAREWRLSGIQPDLKGKRIAVAGGGPAGMQAALNLSRAGATVKLYEKTDVLGGRLIVAAAPPTKDKIKWLIDYFRYVLIHSSVELVYRTELTAGLARAEGFDLVIAAGGGRAIELKIEGLDAELKLEAESILLSRADLAPQDKVVVIGGGTTGCETAEYLAKRNHMVTLVEAGNDLAGGMETMTRLDLLTRLKKLGVRIIKRCQVMAAADRSLTVRCGEEAHILEFDKVVIAVGYSSDEHLALCLREAEIPVLCGGDAVAARNIQSAIYEGYMMAERAAALLRYVGN